MEGKNEQFYRGLLRPKPVRMYVLPSVVVDMVTRVNGQEDDGPQEYFARYPISQASAVRGDGQPHIAQAARLDYLSAIPDVPVARPGRNYVAPTGENGFTSGRLTARTRGGGSVPRGELDMGSQAFGRENSRACSDTGMDTASERKDNAAHPSAEEDMSMEVEKIDLDKALMELQLEFRMRGHCNQNIG
ncbi:hypothetical protein FVE85_6926 [Porphyridium purpureum]|uniref:Uncharacterized protein n=1 Tax=Porphyridium purpureum TaxID=35688 RepID=A0A5J4Z654_PORPP|nr:hypothetical protein FVE85_6926 [Porphyridium purpureum]|eukprot:POR3218..scf295_1